MRAVFKGKYGKRIAGICIVLLTLIYLLATSALAADISAVQTTKPKYEVLPRVSIDKVSTDLYELREDVDYPSQYGKIKANVGYVDVYTSKEANDTATSTFALWSHYASITLTDHGVPTVGKHVSPTGYENMYSGFEVVPTSAVITIDGTDLTTEPVDTLAIAAGNDSARYTVAPQTSGDYYIYVYSATGEYPSVRYNLVDDVDAHNSAVDSWSELTFSRVSDNWFEAKVSVENTSWTCYALGYKGGSNESAAKSDTYSIDGVVSNVPTEGGIELSLNSGGGDKTTYYHNEWTLNTNSFDTLLKLYWNDPNVRIGTISKMDSLKINCNDTEHGTVAAISAVGHVVTVDGTANMLPHMPVYIIAEPADDYNFVLETAEGEKCSYVDSVGAYRYDFVGEQSLLCSWEAPEAFPDVILSYGDTVRTLNFANTFNVKASYSRGVGEKYTFTWDCPEGTPETPVSYTVIGDTSASGVFSKENPTLTVDALWNDAVVTFTVADSSGNTKTITFTAEAQNPSKSVARIGDKYYSFVEDAILDATSGQTIVITANCSLVTGTVDPDWVKDNAGYTIKDGVTLLVPFEETGICYKAEPGHDNHAEWVQPSPYRTLTIPEGKGITVANGGAFSISAKHHVGDTSNNSLRNAGSPTGPVGMVSMEQGGTITVEAGGSLYAWGYIVGDGLVTVRNNGAVYENFQVNDFRGGSHTAWISGKIGSGGKATGVFPLNSYYIQNIEVPLKMEAGSTETCYLSLYVSDKAYSSAIPFISKSGSMFVLNDGYLIKDYEEQTDRTIYEIHGDMVISNMSLSIGGYDFSSGSYNLPLNSNITVDLREGSVTVNQNVAVLPSACIKVAEGTNIKIGKDVNVFFYDRDQWNGTYCYYPGTAYRAVEFAPGREKLMTEADLIDAALEINGTVDATEGYIYTTSGGANIYSTGTGKLMTKAGTATVTKQIIKLATSLGLSAGEAESIEVTPAKLKNAAGSAVDYVQTGTDTYTYNAATGIWECGTHTLGDWTEVTPPAIGVEGLKQATCSVCGTVKTETVLALTAVAQYNGNPYATLTEAVAAAKGKKVQLLTDITEETVISQAAAIYKNGFTANVVAGDGYAVTERKDAYIVWKDVDVVTYAANTLDADSKVFLNLKFFIPSGMSDDVVISWTKENYIKKDGSPATFEDSCTVGELRATGIDDSGRYVLSQDFASGEMSGNMTVHFKDGESELQIYSMKDDKWFENGFVRSILDYSTQALGSSNPKMVNLSRGMMNFASYAKAYFRISYEDTAKQDPADLLGGPLTDEMEALANLWDTSDTTYDNKYSGADLGILNNPNVANEKISQSLVLDSDTNIKTFFYLAEGTNIEDLTFTLTYIEDKVTKQKTLDAYKDGNRYCVEIEHIPVAYWDYGYKITVTSQAAEGEFVIETSVLAWAKNAINKSSATNTNNMGKAMFLYNKYANDYYKK